MSACSARHRRKWHPDGCSASDIGEPSATLGSVLPSNRRATSTADVSSRWRVQDGCMSAMQWFRELPGLRRTREDGCKHHQLLPGLLAEGFWSL